MRSVDPGSQGSLKQPGNPNIDPKMVGLLILGTPTRKTPNLWSSQVSLQLWYPTNAPRRKDEISDAIRTELPERVADTLDGLLEMMFHGS